MSELPAKAMSDKHLMRLYNRRARIWGENYLKRHQWRIAAMYDREDINQDAFKIFLRVYRGHPGLPEPDLLRIYKRGMSSLLTTRSAQCFPNSYAYVDGIGKLVTELDEERSSQTIGHEADAYMDYLSSVIERLPSELIEVLKLLIRDFVGTSCIEQYRTRKLSGRSRVEPLNMALCRLMNVDQSRDLLGELEAAVLTDPGTKQSEE